MSAEQLIALEAAQRELGTLYSVARGFTALQARAETELLPRLNALGSKLRKLLRTSQLTEEQIAQAAQDIRSLRDSWRSQLEQVRASTTYQRALAGLAQDRQDELAQLIPLVFSGVRLIQPAPSLYFPISPSAGRRRPGASPFLNPADCADRILQTLAHGIVPEASGSDWWDCELLSITCAETAGALEPPIALRLAAADVHVAVFAAINQPCLGVFTPRLQAPMSITLAADATDEWWEACEESYRSFRDALQRELVARGQRAEIADTDEPTP